MTVKHDRERNPDGRPARYSRHGDPVQVVGSGELARCLQHESDHLDGILFIDRMDAQRRKAAMKAIRRAAWNTEPAPRVRISPHPFSGPLR